MNPEELAAVIVAAGGGVGGWVAWYVRTGRAGRAVARILKAGHRDLEDLRTILEEQRKGYQHLVGRVDRLEGEVENLERQLADARKREYNLQKKLRTERQRNRDQVAELEKQLCEARERIAELEEQLRSYHPTKDGSGDGIR